MCVALVCMAALALPSTGLAEPLLLAAAGRFISFAVAGDDAMFLSAGDSKHAAGRFIGVVVVDAPSVFAARLVCPPSVLFLFRLSMTAVSLPNSEAASIAGAAIAGLSIAAGARAPSVTTSAQWSSCSFSTSTGFTTGCSMSSNSISGTSFSLTCCDCESPTSEMTTRGAVSPGSASGAGR